jgi:hypothetical protein
MLEAHWKSWMYEQDVDGVTQPLVTSPATWVDLPEVVTFCGTIRKTTSARWG